MPVSGETRQALKLLERIKLHLKDSEAAQLSPSVGDDLNTLISVLDSPVFHSILNIQDSLHELKRQLHKHPSILPVDFDISPSTGELLLNVPADPIPLQTSDYEPTSDPDQNFDYESHLAKTRAALKTDEMEAQSSEMASIIAAPQYVLSPITTESYAEEFQRTIDQGAQGRDIHTLQLFKPEGSSLGFSVVGLRSEQKGELGIFIQEIQPAGIAGRDGRLQEGDQILAIDGQPLDSNISHQQAISILQQARGLVELVVARGGITASDHPGTTTTATAAVSLERSPSAVSDTSKGSDMVLNTEWAQVESIDLVNDGTGLGFGIIGGRSTGVVVKTILPGGVADRDGRLQSGDHILQIGEVNLRGMGSEQVAMVLRQSGSHVRLIVARPVDPAACGALRGHAPIVPTRILADPEEVEKHLAMFAQNGFAEPSPYKGPASVDATFAYQRELGTDYGVPEASSFTGPGMRSGAARGDPDLASDLPEMETFEVELVKDQQGLGITIAGYVCEKEEISGIFVKSIAKGSAADMCGQIRVNDQIIEVDGRSLHGYTNHDAVEVLRSTGKTVKLRLARYLRGAKYQQLQLAIASGELSYPTLPTVQAQIHEPKIVTEAANKEVDVNDINILIDNDYENPLSPRVEAAIQAKWSKIVGPEFEVVVAQLSKFREGGGLGISLEGTVDVEDGKEVRPHHYIRSILPDGPVGVNGKLQSGDELLEVNGEKLLGQNHHIVVATLKELPMHVRMVCARRLLPTEQEIHPSLSQANFSHPYHMEYDLSTVPDFMGRGLMSGPFGGSLTSLTPTSERLVKAKSDGSLAIGTSAASSPPMEAALSKLKSRSLEPLTGLAMWSSEPQIIELMKGDRGLGFSILDYQDPMNPNETVIVIRSLVPGGVAQQDGRLIPGDRLLFVNDINLENASLDAAVQALKGAPKGVVRIGVAKPLPLPESGQSGQISLDNSPTMPDFKSSFDLPPRLSLHLDLEQGAASLRRLSLQNPVVPSFSHNENLQPEINPIKTILIRKEAEVFGVSVNIVDSVGVVITSLTPGSSSAQDGRLQPGDVLVSLNNHSLVDVEARKVGEILRSVDKSSSDVLVQYISADNTPEQPVLQSSNLYLPLKRTLTKSDEEEDEFFDVSESEPPELPTSPPPTLVSDVLPMTRIQEDTVTVSTTTKPALLPKMEEESSSSTKSVLPKLSPIILPAKPSVLSPKPVIRVTSSEATSKGVDSMVTRVKPTVPFKPIRTSLMPKDALPTKAKTKSTTLENVVGESAPSGLTRQWGPQRTVELWRDPEKGLGISIISGKVDSFHGGIFIKNVLADSPAGWNGTLKRGDRILEVNGEDIRNASHAKAVEVIKNATNPVIFIVQSLVPLPKKTDVEVPIVTSEVSPCLEEPLVKSEMSSPVSKISPIHSPVNVSLVPGTPSPSSSNSSSRESTIKRSSSKDIPASPSVEPPPSDERTDVRKSVDADAQKVEKDEEDEKLKHPGDTISEVLEKGKVLTKKGKQIDVASAGNVKLTPSEKADDPESEDEFGYTHSKNSF